MNVTARGIVIGFIAGALSVLIFHQGMVLLLYLMKQLPNFPWNTSLMRGPLPIPFIVNQMFWGGLWGIGFAVVGALIPVANTVMRGIIYGLAGPFLLGNGILVPFFKGGPYLWGGVPARMIIGALIASAFGAGLAVFWSALSRR